MLANNLQIVKIQIDISGRVNERHMHSFLGLSSANNASICYSVFLPLHVKKDILKEYGHVVDCIEKLHCILVYHCLVNFLKQNNYSVTEIQICSDCGKAKILKYLSDYLKGHIILLDAEICVRSVGKRANVHKYLRQVRKDRRLADLKITRRQILRLLK